MNNPNYYSEKTETTVTNANGKTGRVFISGRMAGLSRTDYKKRFDRAEIELVRAGWHPDNIINPAKLGAIYPNLSRDTYLQMDLEMLEDCGTLFALKNWNESEGARTEVWTALTEQMEIIYEE